MRSLVASLLLALFGILYAMPEAGAVLRVSPNTYNVNAGHGMKVLVRIENSNGRFRFAGRGTFCFTFSSVTGCTPNQVIGFQSAASSNLPNGFVDGADVNIEISALIVNKVQTLLNQNPSNALFFFVIQLIPEAGVDLGNGANVPFFVQVNFRMLGGSSAGKALTITRMKLTAVEPGRPLVKNVIITDENRDRGEFCLEIWYTGTGRVRGSWQAIDTTRAPPGTFDLNSEAALTEAQRRFQRTFRVIKPIRVYFGPRGYIKLTLPYDEIPQTLRGVNLLIANFVASRDPASLITGNSLVGNSLVRTGLTMEGDVPQILFRVVPKGEPFRFLSNARVGVSDAAAGAARQLVVTWEAMTRQSYVVEVLIRNPATGGQEKAIAPLASGRLSLPIDALLGQGTVDDLEVSLTIKLPNGEVHPEAKRYRLSSAPAAQ